MKIILLFFATFSVAIYAGRKEDDFSDQFRKATKSDEQAFLALFAFTNLSPEYHISTVKKNFAELNKGEIVEITITDCDYPALKMSGDDTLVSTLKPEKRMSLKYKPDPNLGFVTGLTYIIGLKENQYKFVVFERKETVEPSD